MYEGYDRNYDPVSPTDFEQVEKALRGDKRFEHLITKEAETTIWNLLTALHVAGEYNSYVGEMDYVQPLKEEVE